MTGQLLLSTSRGRFAGNVTTAQFDATPFDTTVQSCDARIDPNCAGQVVVTATDSSLTSAWASAHFTAPSTSPTENPGNTDNSTDTASGVAGQIRLKSQGYALQGVRSSGFQEVNLLTFEVIDTSGKPLKGAAVTFTHASLGGSFVGATRSCTTASPPICTATGVTDATGLVAVPLASGSAAGLVSVGARATASGATVNTIASNLPIVGAKPSGAHVFLECSPKNVPALSVDHTCLTTFYEKNITCEAFFADRFGNVLGRSVVATFASEAGAAGPPVATAELDPTSTTDQTQKLGRAVNTVAIAGYPLPVDVAPWPGEPSHVIVGDSCGTGPTSQRTRNPRDGLVTVIVMARGEEGFVDVNGNGVYDAGEPFIDLGEPFIDANDNGVHDDGEWFLDVNGNGVYDGPNGKWDADTTVWAETRVMYTGLPVYATLNPTPMSIASGDAALLTFAFTDENANPLSPRFTTYALTSTFGLVTADVKFPPTNLDRLGMGFTQQYCDQPAGTTPTVCSNFCPSAPCYVVNSISPGLGGDAGGALVTAGAKPGDDILNLNVTVDGIRVRSAASVPVTVTPAATP
jgi:hypothetical protein